MQADPDRVRTREDLARELTTLRSGAGWTVRDLARTLGAPVATLGDYFSGRHLPGPRQLSLYRQILAECGVTGEEQAERWVAALWRARRTSDRRAAKGAAPYRGLEPFREDDADLFFGRASAVEELLASLQARIEDPAGGATVALVGASGSGKSSVLMAGLLPAINGGALDRAGRRWVARYVTPDQLAAEPPAGDHPDGSRGSVLIVDQFEEILTRPDERTAEVLSRLRTIQEHGLVVIGIRADFYQMAAAEPVLLPALRHSQVLLGPMTTEELRQAVLGPARRRDAAVEEGLVDLVLADLGPGSRPGLAYEPGALPLLSYALLAAWQAAEQNQLTVAGYRAVGGLRGAVRQAAEELYKELTPSEREAARFFFAQLVRLDPDGPPTRRRARRQELVETGDPDQDRAAQLVLERFVAARLLTAGAEDVQISHEALLSAWPRFGAWVESDRDWLRLRHQLADAAEAWVAAQRDESLLWRGARLASASEQADRSGAPGRQLSRIERDFLDASIALRDRQLRAERRRARRTQQLLGAVAVLAVIAIVLAAVAVTARSSANQARDQALSRQVAVEAGDLESSEPSLAAQLAVAAYRISPTVEARSAVVRATGDPIPSRLVGPTGPQFVAVPGSGGLLAVAQSGTDTVALYGRSGGPPARLASIRAGSPSDQDYAVALSPDGHLLAVGGTDRQVTLWDTSRPAHPVRLSTLGGFASTVYDVAFSPHGRRLAAADAGGFVRRWDLSDPRRPVARPALMVPGVAAVKAVAFSPDGTRLAAAGGAGTLAVWTLGDGKPQVASAGSGVTLASVGFSPDGSQVAAAGSDDAVHVWNSSPGGPLQASRAPIRAATSELNTGSFSPDGSLYAAGSSDGTVRLFDPRSWAVVDTLHMPNPVTSVQFTPAGHHLVSADAGGFTRVWSLPTPDTYTESGGVFALGYAHGGRVLTAESSGSGGQAVIWDTARPLEPRRIGAAPDPAGFGAVEGAGAVSPDGHLMAVSNRRAEIQLFVLRPDGTARPIGAALTGSAPTVEQLLFTHDGRVLVAGDDGSQVRLWDVRDPAHPGLLSDVNVGSGEVLTVSVDPTDRVLAVGDSNRQVRLYDISDPRHPALLSTVGGFGSYVFGSAITPDGRTLVAGSADRSVRMWDITDPAHPRLLGQPLTGPTGDIYQVAVSPDGRTLAAGATNGSVWVWDISHRSAPRLMETLHVGGAGVVSLAFDPRGDVLTAGATDGSLHFWDFQLAAATKAICSAAGAPITRSEWSRFVPGAPYHPACP